jgi:hypothetical protein
MGRPSMATMYYFNITELTGEVDEQNGVVRGVSVITGGVQAKGHNLEVDLTTLEQMLEQGQAKGQVPVKWNHKSGADAVNGFLTDFRIEGNKLKADWHLLRSHAQYDHALELAVRMPRNVGLSASFLGKNERKGGKDYARCEDLISVDLVATPAANPDGMFSAVVDSSGKDMSKTVSTHPPAEPTLADLMKEFSAFRQEQEQRFEHLEQRFSVLEDPDPDDDDDLDDDPDAGLDGDGGQDPNADPDGGERGFGSMQEVMQYFEQRLDAMAGEQERREFEGALQMLDERVGDLLELNEQLRGENEILALSLKELSAKTKTTVSFSTAPDGSAQPVLRQTGGRKQTDFEARVEELKAGGKTAAEALTFAVSEDTERYQRHLEAKGAFTQRL